MNWRRLSRSNGIRCPVTGVAAYRIGEDQVRASLQCEISARLTSAAGHFDRSSRFCLRVDVRFAPKASDSSTRSKSVVGSQRAMTSLRPTISPSSSLLRPGYGCASMSPRSNQRDGVIRRTLHTPLVLRPPLTPACRQGGGSILQKPRARAVFRARALRRPHRPRARARRAQARAAPPPECPRSPCGCARAASRA
jgi:hypothetical protein